MSFYELPIESLGRRVLVEENEVTYDNNLIMSLSGITEKTESYFSMKQLKIYTVTYEQNALLEFQFSVDPNLRKVERSALNFFQVLGDVGGLYGIVFSIASSIVSWVNYNNSDNFLVQNLFKVKPEAGNVESESFSTNKRQCSLIEWFQSCLPSCFITASCCKCLHLSRENRFFARARDKLGQELEIAYIL